MKTSLTTSAILVIMICNVSPAMAQRFTSQGQSDRPSVRPDTGFINAEKAYLALKAGDLDNARKFLSSADASNPFSMYVRAALTQDATQAAGMYKVIVNEFPNRPIAKEALLQLYRYHYAAGDYRSAHTDYMQLRKYPGMTQLVDPAGLSDQIPSVKDTVRAQTAPPAPVTNQPAQAPEEHPDFAVQLGVFSTRSNAERFISRMKNDNDIDATISTKSVAGKTLFAVITGDFQTREAAESFASDLRSRSIDCIVVETGESEE